VKGLIVNKLILILPLMLILFVGCNDTADENVVAENGTVAQVSDAKMAADFDLIDINGEHVKLSDYKGKVVILDFWATWCPPCKKALPHLQEISSEYPGNGIKVIGVSVDRDGWDVVRPFMAEKNFDFTVVLGGEEIVKAYGGINSIPTTFIIGPDGVIGEKFVGYKDKSEYLNAANKLKH
jgi:cytochrome c biogenesis protein CcmG/thiol:disulfide interchange protein DsbE